MEVLRRCPLAIAQRLVHCAIALSTVVLDRVTKTMSAAPLLTNNLDNSKQKTSNLLSPAPPPYSWSLLGKSEGPAPPPSSKISWSFDLAWNPESSTSEDSCRCSPLRSQGKLPSRQTDGGRKEKKKRKKKERKRRRKKHTRSRIVTVLKRNEGLNWTKRESPFVRIHTIRLRSLLTWSNRNEYFCIRIRCCVRVRAHGIMHCLGYFYIHDFFFFSFLNCTVSYPYLRS